MDNNTSSLLQCPPLDPITWNRVFSNEGTTISSIIATTFHILLAPFAVFFNGAVIFLVYKFEALQNARFTMIALLALTDFFSGLIAQPLFIAKELYHLLLKDVNCALNSTYYYVSSILWFITITQLICLTYERYVAIVDPLKYPQRIKIKWLLVISLINWIANILIIILFNAYTPMSYVIGITLTCWVLLCVAVFIYLNVRIIIIRRKQKRRIDAQERSVRFNNEFLDQDKTKDNGNTLKWVLTAFFLVNLPMGAEQLYTFINKTQFNETKEIRSTLFFTFHPWVDACLNLNSLLCPLIYGICTKKLRFYFRRYFFRENALNIN